jgi:hypothetical protein
VDTTFETKMLLPSGSRFDPEDGGKTKRTIISTTEVLFSEWDVTSSHNLCDKYVLIKGKG